MTPFNRLIEQNTRHWGYAQDDVKKIRREIIFLNHYRTILGGKKMRCNHCYKDVYVGEIKHKRGLSIEMGIEGDIVVGFVCPLCEMLCEKVQVQ